MLLDLPPIRSAAEYQAHAGITAGEFRRLRRDGKLWMVRRGLFMDAQPLTPELRHACLTVATARTLGPGAVVSHVSAGVLYGLPVPRTALESVHFFVPPTNHGGRFGPVVKRGADLDASEVGERGGVRLTSVPRTVADLARTLPFEWGVAAADAALHRGLTTSDRLVTGAQLRRHRGVERAMAVAAFADARAESPLESISRAQLMRVGVPAPALQYPVRLRGRVVAHADFAWPEFGVIGECDGRVKYGQLLRDGETAADAVMREKARENLIAQAGWWIVRWDFTLAMDADALGRRVRDAFALGRPSLLDAS